MKGKKLTGWGNLPFVKILGRFAEFFGVRLLIGLVSAICALIFFGWLANEIFAGETKMFDDSVRQAAIEIASPPLTNLMIFFSFVGSVYCVAPLGIFALFSFIRLKWRRAAVLFVLTMIGETFLELSLKGFFRRARPEALYGYALPQSYSFPSGHALGAFCFFGILTWLITARMESRKLKILLWCSTSLLVFVIGFSRIYLGVHYPSDVIGGYAAALVWTMTIALGDFFFSRRKAKNS